MTGGCPSGIVPYRSVKRRIECGGIEVFSADRSGSLFAVCSQAQVLNEWRDAARLVAARWATFVEAEREARTFAFASYVAALDAEEAAAAQVAAVMTPLAA
jgi:hypothetical protein